MLLVNLRKETLNTIHVEDMDGKVIHTFHHVDGKFLYVLQDWVEDNKVKIMNREILFEG